MLEITDVLQRLTCYRDNVLRTEETHSIVLLPRRSDSPFQVALIHDEENIVRTELLSRNRQQPSCVLVIQQTEQLSAIKREVKTGEQSDLSTLQGETDMSKVSNSIGFKER